MYTSRDHVTALKWKSIHHGNTCTVQELSQWIVQHFCMKSDKYTRHIIKRMEDLDFIEIGNNCITIKTLNL